MMLWSQFMVIWWRWNMPFCLTCSYHRKLVASSNSINLFLRYIYLFVAFCIKVQEEMRKGEIALEKFVITKSLTKPPEDYPDAKNQPHVQVRNFCYGIYGWFRFSYFFLNFFYFYHMQVALRLKKNGYPCCSAGDTIPYVICCQQVLTSLIC